MQQAARNIRKSRFNFGIQTEYSIMMVNTVRIYLSWLSRSGLETKLH